MAIRVGFVLGVALLAGMPLAGASAACDTEDARELTQIHYAQVMANWQANDPDGYDAAQEWMTPQAAAARRAGDPVKRCQFFEKAIKAARNPADQQPAQQQQPQRQPQP
jgi:hypothetical protein